MLTFPFYIIVRLQYVSVYVNILRGVCSITLRQMPSLSCLLTNARQE